MEHFSPEIESLLTFWFLSVTCSSPIGSSTFSFLVSYIFQQPFPGWCGRCHLFVYTLCGNSDPVRTLCLVHGLISSRWFMVGPYSSFLVGLCRFESAVPCSLLVDYILISGTRRFSFNPSLWATGYICPRRSSLPRSLSGDGFFVQLGHSSPCQCLWRCSSWFYRAPMVRVGWQTSWGLDLRPLQRKV